MKVVGDAIGPQRVELRLSPWSTFQGMRMKDLVPQFSEVIIRAKELGLGYIHLIEPRVSNTIWNTPFTRRWTSQLTSGTGPSFWPGAIDRITCSECSTLYI